MKFKTKTNLKKRLEINWDLVNAYLSRWKPGTDIDIEIVRHVPKKSDSQRKFYWAVILPEFAKGVGYEPDEYEDFHEYLKIIYHRVKPDKRGIYRNVPAVFADDSEKDVQEKAEFIEWVLRKAAKEGIYIET